MSWSSDLRPPSLMREISARKWSVSVIAVLALASAVYYSFRLPATYAAESRVLVNSPQPAAPEESAPTPNMATEQEIARSPEVVRVVSERLGLDASRSEVTEDLSIENPENTDILILTYTDRDPVLARQVAQAFAEEYVKLRRRGAVQAQLESVRETQVSIAAFTEELQRIERRLMTASRDAIVDSLISRADLLTGLLVQQKQEMRSLQAAPEVAEVFQPAVGLGRVAPSYPRNAAVALLLGLALGVAQAGLRGRLDDRLRSVDEAEPYLRSSTLAIIPSLPGLDGRGSPTGFTSRRPASISDMFVPLRVSFLALASTRDAGTVVVTSASQGEGRSTVTANLALSLALAGRRVTVVCCDPEQHRLEGLFGADAEIGLAQVLDGSVPLAQAQLSNIVRNLSLLPCGRPTGSYVELSQTPGMQATFESIRERSDFVLVDGPPIGDPNAVSLLPLVDGVLFVVDCRRMHARRLAIARRQLARVNADVLGIVFNRATASVVRPQPRFLAAASSSVL